MKLVGCMYIDENTNHKEIHHYWGEDGYRNLIKLLSNLPDDTVILSHMGLTFDFIVLKYWGHAHLVGDALGDDLRNWKAPHEPKADITDSVFFYPHEINPNLGDAFDLRSGIKGRHTSGNLYQNKKVITLNRRHAMYLTEKHIHFDTCFLLRGSVRNQLSETNTLKYQAPKYGFLYKNAGGLDESLPDDLFVEREQIYNQDDLEATYHIWKIKLKKIARSILLGAELLGFDNKSIIERSIFGPVILSIELLKKLKYNNQFKLLPFIAKIKNKQLHDVSLAGYEKFIFGDNAVADQDEYLLDISKYTKTNKPIFLNASMHGGFHYPSKDHGIKPFAFHCLHSQEFCYFIDFTGFYNEIMAQAGLFEDPTILREFINLKNSSTDEQREGAKAALTATYGNFNKVKHHNSCCIPDVYLISSIARILILELLDFIFQALGENFVKLVHINTDSCAFLSKIQIKGELLQQLQTFTNNSFEFSLSTKIFDLTKCFINNSNSYAYRGREGEIHTAGIFNANNTIKNCFVIPNMKAVLRYCVLGFGEKINPATICISIVDMPTYGHLLEESYGRKRKKLSFFHPALHLNPKVIDLIDHHSFSRTMELFRLQTPRMFVTKHEKIAGSVKGFFTFEDAIKNELFVMTDSMLDSPFKWNQNQLDKLSEIIKESFLIKFSTVEKHFNAGSYADIMGDFLWQ